LRLGLWPWLTREERRFEVVPRRDLVVSDFLAEGRRELEARPEDDFEVDLRAIFNSSCAGHQQSACHEISVEDKRGFSDPRARCLSRMPEQKNKREIPQGISRFSWRPQDAVALLKVMVAGSHGRTFRPSA
jgi:hypothetical protein